MICIFNAIKSIQINSAKAEKKGAKKWCGSATTKKKKGQKMEATKSLK